MKILVIGGSGFIGGRFVRMTTAQGHSVAYTYGRKPFGLPDVPAYRVDFTELDNGLQLCLNEVQPDVVLYVAVSLPTAEYNLQQMISVVGVQQVTAGLSQLNQPCRLIYVSTNAVFGSGRGMHREDEPTSPELRSATDPYQAYALTKAAGERAALDSWPNTIVARTAVVDGRLADGSLSYRIYGLVKALQEGNTVMRFNDRFISPTLVDNLVEALLEISQPAYDYQGILHLAGRERTTDCDYALSLARQLGVSTELVQANSLKDSPAMQGSPADTSLDVTFTQNRLQTRLLNVQEQLAWLFSFS